MNPVDVYPPADWRLLITPPLEGAMNMAIDEAILRQVAAGESPPTVRFFDWQPPCLSLGYNQRWHEIDAAACERLGYTWTRRPTGGRAILHINEVTYSLIIPAQDPRIKGGIVESYRVLSYGLLDGLARLGLETAQANRKEIVAQLRARKGGPVCFDTPSRYEIVWQGQKLIGSAQLRRRKTVLQHGTLPLCGDLNRILAVLAFSPEERQVQQTLLPERAVTLEQATGQIFTFNTVSQALADGFANQLSLTLTELPLTEAEQALAEDLYQSQYAHAEWIRRV